MIVIVISVAFRPMFRGYFRGLLYMRCFFSFVSVFFTIAFNITDSFLHHWLVADTFPYISDNHVASYRPMRA